jgi:hypothetical protein
MVGTRWKDWNTMPMLLPVLSEPHEIVACDLHAA